LIDRRHFHNRKQLVEGFGKFFDNLALDHAAPLASRISACQMA
jgi:hypothetical protein